MLRTGYLIFILYTLSITSCKENENVVPEDPLIAKAQAIHDRVITLDTHCDIYVNNFTDSINYSSDINTHINLPKMTAGGLDVAWFVVYSAQDSLSEKGYKAAYENALAKFRAIHKLVEIYAPNDIALATTSDDVRRIHNSGKKVAMIGVENGYAIGLDINKVREFYDLGARYMSLAHNGHNQLSDSATGESENEWLHDGLSDLGKEVIAEMNRLGMMIDISHPSKEAIKQMIALSKAPIIASHSSARSLCDKSRNLDDEQLEWIKQNGGVVQAVAVDMFLNTEKYKALVKDEERLGKQIMDSLGYTWIDLNKLDSLSHEAQDAYFDKYLMTKRMVSKKIKSSGKYPPAVNVSDFVDHIDYMIGKMGIDHVGISSDFDGGGGIDGWMDASETFNVTLELVKRDYSEKDIAKLWSGNLLRVLDEVQAVAASLQVN